MNSISAPRHRILYIDHCALMSGGEIALLNLVKALDRSRFEPIVLLCSDGPLVDHLGSAQVETHVIPLDPAIANTRKDSLGISTLSQIGSMVRSWRYVQRLKEFIQTHHIDLVHTNSLKADILGGVAARMASRPLIWHVRDRIAEDYLPAVVSHAFRFLCNFVPHVVIANSASTLDTIQRRRDERSAVVYSGTQIRSGQSVIHDGLNPQDFSRSNVDSTTAIDPVVGLLGRIAPWKGQHIFIRAASAVLQVLPRVRFRIIGKVMFEESDYEVQLKQLVNELGVSHAVTFSGFRSDVANALSELTLLVHASTVGEPFGQVIVEGMAAGLPVVATNGGGVPEIVVHGRTGLLVPMNDTQAMANAIVTLLSDPHAAREMGRKGKERALSTFSIERTARTVEKIYDQLLQEHR